MKRGVFFFLFGQAADESATHGVLAFHLSHFSAVALRLEGPDWDGNKILRP